MLCMRAGEGVEMCQHFLQNQNHPRATTPSFWVLSGFSKASTTGDITQLSQLCSLRRALTNRQHLVRWEYIDPLVCVFALIVGLLVHAAPGVFMVATIMMGTAIKAPEMQSPAPSPLHPVVPMSFLCLRAARRYSNSHSSSSIFQVPGFQRQWQIERQLQDCSENGNFRATFDARATKPKLCPHTSLRNLDNI